MARLAVLVPEHWLPLADALRAAGHAVRLLPDWQPLVRHREALDVALAEVRDALTAAGTDPLLLSLVDALPVLATRAQAVRETVLGHPDPPADGAPEALVVTCTTDATGRAAVQAGRERGIPVLHVTHACQSLDPRLAAWARTAPGPGEWVLVPGERDAAWWAQANPGLVAQGRVRVTGHALWDGYAALTRDTSPREKPVVLWACESGASPWQSAETWHSRAVPALAYRAFLDALHTLGARGTVCTVILKARAGEEPAVLQQWMREAFDVLRGSGHDLVVSIEPPAAVLPRCDVVVCQQSNIGVEALLLGVPVLNLARAGSTLLDEHVPTFHLASDTPGVAREWLVEALDLALSGRSARDWQAIGRHYHAGTGDGRSLARVVDTIGSLVRAGMREHAYA